MYDKLRSEFERVQQSYSDSLDKISALQIELEIQNGTCSQCKSRKDKDVMQGMVSYVSCATSHIIMLGSFLGKR